ncbi:acyl-CoA dehydrogenase family protein [Ancylobacter sp. VNQ12]|uniref:acyl-CoA dehydrogenase family protein n=1 Tax=Ancylobacter sp. VNQ12 TaxID=3400920 RepID=UPI003BFDA056
MNPHTHFLEPDASTHSHAPVGSASDLIGRAEALAPALRERAAETERLRQPPEATRHDVVRTGIHRLFQPARYGGAEAPFRAAVEVLTAVGRACGSTAWVVVQNIAHNSMLAQWPQAAQDDVWGANPAALLSGILIPGIGKARRVENGYVLSGRWPFVSGVSLADWVLFTAFTPGPDGKEEDRHFILPRSDYQILDTWHAMGLKGSASHDVVVDEVFVPEHRTTTIEAMRGREARYPGEPVVFRSPLYAMFGVFIGSSALGIAEGGVHSYVEQARTRISRASVRPVSDFNTQHVKVAEALAAIKAARLLLYGVCDQMTEIIASGRMPTLEERARCRAEATFAGQLSTRAVNVVWDAVGGSGIYDANPLSRYFRDMSAANRHITQNWDVNASTHGRVVLGLPIDNPAL